MRIVGKLLLERHLKWLEYWLFLVGKERLRYKLLCSPFLPSSGSGIPSTKQIKVRASSTLSIQYPAGSCSRPTSLRTEKGKSAGSGLAISPTPRESFLWAHKEKGRHRKNDLHRASTFDPTLSLIYLTTLELRLHFFTVKGVLESLYVPIEKFI